MARKINWQKITSQKRIENETIQCRLDQKYAHIDRQFQFNHIWQIGQYQGNPIHELKTGYLIWVCKNLKNPFRSLALRELIARGHKSLIHKQSD